jgi:hypothetical protein
VNTCEVTDRCMAPAWFQVRARINRQVTEITDTCKRHLSVAVEQGLGKGSVTVTRVPRG